MPISNIPTYTSSNPYLVYVEEKLDSRTGTPWEAGGRRGYIRKWLVRVKDNTLGANVIARAMGLAPFQLYATEDGKEWDTNAMLVAVRLEDPVDNQDGFHRIVVAEYSTEMPPGGPAFSFFGIDPAGAQNNPELVPPDIEWDGDDTREAPPYDLDGKAYVNSADQPYKPAPSFEQGHSILVYTRNQLSFNSRYQIRLTRAVNADTFLGEPPGTVQLLRPRAKLMWIGPKSYWRVTYRFRFNSPEAPVPVNSVVAAGTGGAVAAAMAIYDPSVAKLKTWQPLILDSGTMQLPPEAAPGSMPIPIFRGAHAVSEPVLLNGAGREQKERDANGKLKPVWNRFRQFLAIPFTPILVAGLVMPG